MSDRTNKQTNELVELSAAALQTVRGGAGEDGYSSCVANVGDARACREYAAYLAYGSVGGWIASWFI